MPADPFTAAGYRDLIAALRLQILDTGGIRPIALLDGGSGAGKSTLATPLAASLDAELVRLDDLYPGWDGLEAGSRAVTREIIPDGRWRRWDWAADAAGPWELLDPTRPLVVEGCGALSVAARDMATFGIWIELGADERRRRAIARDGDAYAPHWERWARQEERFCRREHPDLIADVVIDGDLIPWSADGRPR